MARELHVFPKVSLVGSTWTLRVNVYEHAAYVPGVTSKEEATSRFVHEIPAGVTVTVPLRELKVAFDLTVGDTDTDQDVDDMLFVDDVKPGPAVETVWGNWQERAEGIIGVTDPTLAEYWAAWSKADTAKTRNDVASAVSGRGWTVTAVHQHEGDGTNTDG